LDGVFRVHVFSFAKLVLLPSITAAGRGRIRRVFFVQVIWALPMTRLDVPAVFVAA
jgi:hypothetical protein